MCFSLAYLVFSKILIKDCAERLTKLIQITLSTKSPETKISLKEHKTSAVMNQSALNLEEVFGGAEASSFLSWLISHVNTGDLKKD